MRKVVLFFICCYLFLLSGYAQIGNITTVAGNGYRGAGAFSGDGGPALDAELGALGAVVFDAYDNYYIVDMGNNRIRMVTKATGIINTIVGGGSFFGDGGPATSAELNLPDGIALDKSGNIYIADDLDYVVRRVDSATGIIKIIAGMPGMINRGYYGDGGPATSALLDEPTGVDLDDTGNIYIADFHNNVIRKVTISTGIISTIVGTGYGYWNGPGTWTGSLTGDGGPATSATFYGPCAIAFDKSENMYIADDENNVVRKVAKATGIVTTCAGNGIGGYTGDGGQATLAELWTPIGVKLDSIGDLYIADNSNNVIRRVATNGNITTFIGNGVSDYTGDGGPATDAELRYPSDIAFDSKGNVYLNDAGNYVVRKVTFNTTGISNIINNEAVVVFPNPTKNQITIQFATSQNFVSTIQFYDVKGREVLTQKLTKATTTIDCSGLSDGAYFYKITYENGRVIKADKVVVER